MTLAELRTEYELPGQVVDFCSRNGLFGLKAIQAYEAKHGSFMDLSEWDESIEKALLDLLTVVRILDNKEVGQAIKPVRTSVSPVQQPQKTAVSDLNSPLPSNTRSSDPSLEKLVVLYNLSVRAFNVCTTNGLTSLSTIVRYYRLNGGFSKLKNCGKKTGLELEDLLIKNDQDGYASLAGPDDAKVLNEVELQRIFMTEYVGLSTRARNILDRHIDEPNALLAIRFFMQKGRKLPKLNGAAGVTMTELRSMRDRLITAASTLAELNIELVGNESLSALDNWCIRNNILGESATSIRNDEGQLTVLRFIRHHQLESDESKAGKLYHAYLGLGGTERSYQELADELGLSRERVRQIIDKLDQKYPKRLSFLHDLPGVQDRYPDLLAQGSALVITEQMCDRLNAQEGSDCSPLLLALIAKVLSGPDFELGHWRWFGLSNKDAKKLQSQRPFIVRTSEVKAQRAMMAELQRLITEPRKEQITLDVYSLVPESSALNRDALAQATISLVGGAFPDVQVHGACFVLEPNKRPTQEKILEDILTELGEPSHGSVIVEKWNDRAPSRPVTMEAVRSVVVRNKELFFSIGRSSTYGLRKWEKERPDLKGGTIRDIIWEELHASHRPLHISELAVSIRRYRDDVDTGSIRTNLSLERNGRFVLLPNGFIGLGDRQYPEMRSDLKSVPGALLRTSVLQKFVGNQLDAVADYLVEQGEVHRDIVVASLQLLVDEGRIILGPDRSVIHVTSDPEGHGDPGSFTGELPFPVA